MAPKRPQRTGTRAAEAAKPVVKPAAKPAAAPAARPASSLDVEAIRALSRIVREEELASLKVSFGGLELVIEKYPAQGAAPQVVHIPAAPAVLPAAPAAPAVQPTEAKAEAPKAAPTDPTVDVIKSPMVGTFYNCPSPGAEPFVKPGDTVKADTVVCIVEAMKVMNEIRAGKAGQITEALVGNAQPVEFAQALYRIRPA